MTGAEGNLAAMVRSYLEDNEVALSSDDIRTEIRTNLWSYSSVGGERGLVEVTDALADVANGLRLRFAGAAGPVTFYSWYDEQAGQLRCCLVSRPPSGLPFGGSHRTTTDASEVARIAVADAAPGLIPWSESREVSEEVQCHDDASFDETPFPVWVAIIR